MTEKLVPAYSVRIMIAGDINDLKKYCRQYCFNVGLCVTVTPTTFIYTGGEETGAIIELINYGRFPSDHEHIWERALDLAHGLMFSASQTSFTIQDGVKSLWFSRREEIDDKRRDT